MRSQNLIPLSEVQAATLAGGLWKADPYSPCIERTAASTAQIKAGTSVAVAGKIIQFAAATAISMPATMLAGTDYAVYVCYDGVIVASSAWDAPTGYTTSNSRKIGGFYYALSAASVATTNRARTSNVATITLGAGHGFVTGDVADISLMSDATYNGVNKTLTVSGNNISYDSTGTDEGSTADTAGQCRKVNNSGDINSYSIWDMKFRPTCPDPRGMVLVANTFWADIWLMGVNYSTSANGYRTSVKGDTIADGSSPPYVPVLFGGSGGKYSSLTWYEAAEVLAAAGKQLLTYIEFTLATSGVTEATSSGTDPVVNCRRAGFTSRWGLELATGNMYVWGRDLSFRFDHITSLTAASRARATNVATIVTGSAHNLLAGDVISLETFGGTGYNRSFVTVASIVNSTTFTYNCTGSDEGTTADTAGRVKKSGPDWGWVNVSRGQLYIQGGLGLVAPLMGGNWGNGSVSGSRCAHWSSYPWSSGSNIGARGRSDHLILV